jgi:tetratricopeptide (TPR) repeat protein
MSRLVQIAGFGRMPWILYAALISSLAALYFHGVTGLLTDVDDGFTFEANEPVSRNFANFFTLSAQWAGRPTSAFFFLLGSALWGNDPFWFHILSVSLHVLTSLVLAAALRRMGIVRSSSFLAGGLFLVNTSHFQAIYWISALMYPLYMLFMLGFLSGFLHFLESGKSRWAVQASISLLAAMMANIAAVSVVAFCFYWQWSRGVSVRQAALRLALPFAAAIFLAIALISISAEQVVTSLVVKSIWQELPGLVSNVGRNLPLLLSRLITLAHWAPFAFYEQFDWELYVGAGVLILLVAAVVRRQPGLSDGAAWILLSIVPFLPIMLNPEVARQLPQGPSRYLYAPAAGTALILACCAERLRARIRGGWWVYAGFVVLLSVSSYLAMQKVEGLSYYAAARNLEFEGRTEDAALQLERAIAQGGIAVPRQESFIRLCRIQIATGGDYWKTLTNALEDFPDDFYLRNVQHALATFEETRSSAGSRGGLVMPSDNGQLNSILADLFHNLGYAYSRQGDAESSVMACKQALLFEPLRASTLQLLADELAHAGRSAELEELASTVASMSVDNPEMAIARASVLRKSGRLEAAVEILEDALALDENARLFNALGVCELQRGEGENAARAFASALEMGTHDAVLVEAHTGLVSALMAKGSWNEARSHLEQARAFASTSTEVRVNLASYYTMLGIELFRRGSVDQAIEAYNHALELNGNDSAARVNLGWSLFKTGNVSGSIKAYKAVLERQRNSIAHFNLGLAYLTMGDLAAADSTYAAAVSAFGAAEARKIGAVADLNDLVTSDVQATAARRLLTRYWSANR